MQHPLTLHPILKLVFLSTDCTTQPLPSRSQRAEIARDVVTQHPKTFGDVTDDRDMLGCGYTSLLSQIKTRVVHLNRNNTLSKLWQPKRKDAESTFLRNSLNQQDSYGCVNWQPKYLPDGETPASLEVKRQMLINLFTTEGPRGVDTGRVDELMAITYWKQHDFINSSPPPQVSTISEEWPFLFESRWLCTHFETLTGVNLLSRLSEAFQNKGRWIVNLFFQQRLKWKGSVLSLLKELEDDYRTFEDPNLVAIAAVLLLMVFFKEPTESLFILAHVSTVFVLEMWLNDYSLHLFYDTGDCNFGGHWGRITSRHTEAHYAG